MRLAIVVGLAAEARIVGSPGAEALIGAGQADRLAADLEAAIAGGARRRLSFGVAGALAPRRVPGDLVVGRVLIDGATRTPCDPAWAAAMMKRLAPGQSSSRVEQSPDDRATRVFLADIAGADAPVGEAAGKAALRAATDAAAVDMESAVVARAAARHRLPFAILRAIADPADRALPPAALSAMRADGGVDLAGIAGALVRRPGQLPALARLALDARRAFGALARARALLGADFASIDLGEL